MWPWWSDHQDYQKVMSHTSCYTAADPTFHTLHSGTDHKVCRTFARPSWSLSWHFWGPVKYVITRILRQMRVGLSWDREDLARAFLSKVEQLMPSSPSPSSTSTWSWSLPPSSSRWSSSRPDRTTWGCLGRGRHSLGRRKRGGGTIWSTRVRSPLPADSGTMSRSGRILRLKRLCSKTNNYPNQFTT